MSAFFQDLQSWSCLLQMSQSATSAPHRITLRFVEAPSLFAAREWILPLLSRGTVLTLLQPLWALGFRLCVRTWGSARHPAVIARVPRDTVFRLPAFEVIGASPHIESTHGLRRPFKGRDFTATSAQPLRNIPLPHCSRVSQRQFCIIFFSKRRTVFIPSIKPSSSASFFRESACQRSEARVTLRKPKNKRRISSSVKPSRLAH
jgi:hypothetical protein